MQALLVLKVTSAPNAQDKGLIILLARSPIWPDTAEIA